jgi:DNA damage-binding protein 1
MSIEGAHMLIPVALPYKGVIVIGRSTITYVNGNDISISVGMDRTDITASSMFENDPCRHLLGDRNGNLSLLILCCENGSTIITSMVVERLGISSIPECLTSLANGLVYVGSCFGDSQLIKLLPSMDDSGSYLQTLDNFPNIGPIMDMCLMGSDRQEQSQVLLYRVL